MVVHGFLHSPQILRERERERVGRERERGKREQERDKRE
jgi:hypothetical protein